MALFYWLLFSNMVLDQFADGGVLVSICIVAKCVLTITYPSMLLSDVNCFSVSYYFSGMCIRGVRCQRHSKLLMGEFAHHYQGT